MSSKKDVKELLSMLDDDDVMKKIVSIASKKPKRQSAPPEKKASDDKLELLKKEKNKLKKENESLKEQLGLYNDMSDALSKKLKKYADDYSESEKVYEAYCSLDSEILKSLSNIISTVSVLHFIISAGQWRNIEALWKNISYRLDNTSAEEIERMTYIFEWLFNKYNEIYEEYSILDVKPGDLFDSDFHSKGSKSAVTGEITEILLKGYKNNTNGKIMEKSIVRI
ncbi:MAG: hypothetical protein NC320_06330 [Clostridium sp.]|nr:hypothetical protein [Clostridium sp.]MCM1547627.1 hypothetical protein [Ruminococcus sp.]